MLTLSLQGLNIPLPVDFSMRLTIKSPVCAFDKIPFSYSLDFSLPRNRHTSAILGKPERVAKYRAGNDQKLPGFEVAYGGALFMAGTLLVKVSGNNYSLTVLDLVGELSEKEQERSILDIPKFAEPQTWENSANYTPDTHSYCCFPVINAGFFKDKGIVVKRTVYENAKPTSEQYDIEVLSYCFNAAAAYRVNALNEDKTVKLSTSNFNAIGKVYENGRVTVVTPFFFLKNIINESLKSNGFHIRENILNDSSNFRNICIYNKYDISETIFLQGFQNMFGISPILLGPDGQMILVGSYYKSAGKNVVGYDRAYTLREMKMKDHLPKISFGNLLLSTQNLLNICFDFLPNRTVNVLYREDLLKHEAINLQKYFLGTWYPGEKKNVSLKFVREHDNSDLVFSERYTDLSDRRSNIKEPVANWEELLAIPYPYEGDIRQITSLGIFAEFKLITQTDPDPQTKEQFTIDVFGWEEISIGLQPGWYEYGRDETEEIKTSWSTCYGTVEDTLVNQPGNQSSWKDKQEALSPRLLIYKGNNQGGNQRSDFSFEFEGENGLLKTTWNRTAPWWANRLPLIGYFNFSANALRSIIWNKCLPYRTDETAFMIEKIEVDLFIGHIGVAELTVVKRD